MNFCSDLLVLMISQERYDLQAETKMLMLELKKQAYIVSNCSLCSVVSKC